MLLSILFAWLCVVFFACTALKWLARVSGLKKLNAFFRKIHIPFGTLLVICAGIHGVLAGNPSTATLTGFRPAAVLFTANWGTAAFLFAIVLGAVYLLRKNKCLKKRWMNIHRLATVAMLLCLLLHLLDTGIQLPARLGEAFGSLTQQSTSSQTDDSDISTADSGTDTAPTQSSAQSQTVVEFSGAVLQDGSYTGSAQGYNGTITVLVTVQGGAVTQIDVVSESDSPQFFSRAKELLQSILGQQSLQVDTVTGATYSSAGLLNAVYDALQSEAVVSGTLQITQIDLSAVNRKGH